MSRTVSDKYVKNAAVCDKCMYVRETVLGGNPVFICSPSIIAPFALLPTVPCAQVWPEMICQMRLFQRGHLWTQLQFPCSKPASHSKLIKSKLLTLSSVERNENNQIKTIHQMPCGRRWTSAGAQSGCFAPTGPEFTHWGENKKDSFVAPEQYFLDTLVITWAMPNHVGNNFSEATTLAFSKTGFWSG